MGEELTLELESSQDEIRPGRVLKGRAFWNTGDNVEKVTIHLLWHTAGKGTEDVGIAATSESPTASRSGERRFELAIPEGPYSFSGKLITLSWALECVLYPSEISERLEIVLSPSGRELMLYKVAS